MTTEQKPPQQKAVVDTNPTTVDTRPTNVDTTSVDVDSRARLAQLQRDAADKVKADLLRLDEKMRSDKREHEEKIRMDSLIKKVSDVRTSIGRRTCGSCGGAAVLCC